MRELLTNVESLPNVEIAQTPEDFKVIAERSLNNRGKVICYLGSVELLLQAYEQAYEDDYYIPTRMASGVLVKMLAPDTEIMRKYQSSDAGEVRETRALPDHIVMDYSVMIHDDTVVFFAQDPKLYGLSIISPAIAQTMKGMFNVMWENAKS
ncbi:MAG: hypothetical protein NTX06_08370 [Proteobacteria bacterium]|nr:hypothetical protein [Pseudomonadota bacterium]